MESHDWAFAFLQSEHSHHPSSSFHDDVFSDAGQRLHLPRGHNLAEYYTDKQLPGVGISIGLTRLFFVLEDQGYLNDGLNTAPADALILPMTDDLSHAITLATQLREAGIRAQIHAEQKKFKQKISYADKLSIPYAIFLGEEEIKEGVAAVKNMRTGEQVKLPYDEVVAHIDAGLIELRKGTPILDKGAVEE